MIIPQSLEELASYVEQEGKKVFFFSADWCGDCRYIQPFLPEIEAENPEFSLMWSATDKCLKNRFIETADDYGLSRFEKMLGITADSNESLETRRMRVRNRWFNKLPYTIRTLTEKVKQIVGDSYNFTISGNLKDYELNLTVYTLSDSQNKELEYLLSVIISMKFML